MLLFNDSFDAPSGSKIIAIGSFDGLHLGHQYLLGLARQKANELNLPLSVYTFDPPSKVFMRGEGFLLDLSEKIELLKLYGAEIAIVVPFNQEFAKRSKEIFIQELAALEATHIFVGEDFFFGQGRKGGVGDLQKNFSTFVVPLQEHNHQAVKSTQIRHLLKDGDVSAIEELLGRPYCARGTVVQGDQLGRTIGFPTANIQVAHSKLLPFGVYAVTVVVGDQTMTGVANIGFRPTLNGKVLRFEVHIFDFDAQLYGHEIAVSFVAKIRDEMKFASLEALKEQIAKDSSTARTLLNK